MRGVQPSGFSVGAWWHGDDPDKAEDLYDDVLSGANRLNDVLWRAGRQRCVHSRAGRRDDKQEPVWKVFNTIVGSWDILQPVLEETYRHGASVVVQSEVSCYISLIWWIILLRIGEMDESPVEIVY